MKRKRSATCSHTRKKQCLLPDRHQGQTQPLIQHSILTLYYQHTGTLGNVLLDWLPCSSRIRRRRLRQFDADFPHHAGFLSKVVVGYSSRASPGVQISRREELVAFTQTHRSDHGNSNASATCHVAEVVDFAIWTLFQRCSSAVRAPAHLLCHGFQRAGSLNVQHTQEFGMKLPGIVQRVSNANVEVFKQPPWTDIANLLGKDAETILLSLFLDCGLFQQLDAGQGNWYQLSGDPVTRLAPVVRPDLDISRQYKPIAKPGSITFARNRMFHARPSLNGQGQVQLGLKHIHALNRYSDLNDPKQDVRIMQYMFPRQFGLHNVFTSKPNPSETTQLLKDYTMREIEIANFDNGRANKIPRRLRGVTSALVCKMRRNHQSCSYSQLLRHYCPIPTSDVYRLSCSPNLVPPSSNSSDQFVTQLSNQKVSTASQAVSTARHTTSLLDNATPVSHVTAFCQATMLRLLPRNALGIGEDGKHNWQCLLASIYHFITLRRFESTTLHEVCQHIKIRTIDWLRPPNIRASAKMSTSDRLKRIEILQELIYYVFDSVLIPLIRSNFYVTETGVHRYRLYYFRHDVWKKMVEPNLALMRLHMFVPLNSRQLKHNICTNSLGHSHMRLLPKEHGTRPIVNLKRRATKVFHGKQILGPSTNMQMAPIFSVLNHERHRQPRLLASGIFSVSEALDKIRDFKAIVTRITPKPLFFVKVDITSCFDTIPQHQLLQLIDRVLTEEEYQIAKHVEVKRIPSANNFASDRPAPRYISRAVPAGINPLLSLQTATHLANKRQRHLFVGTDHEKVMKIGLIQKLLSDHLQNHVVRIGHKHFKQVRGIPQGSVLSSLLCNVFYGDFEHEMLSFLDPSASLLLRLIDDFLLITTDEAEARQFLTAMNRGSERYGIVVNAEKSLVNFEASIDGHKIPRLIGTTAFPYCGMLIDTRDLHIRKDRRPKDLYVQNGLTIGRGGKVGNILQHKIVSSLKRQLHAMTLDGSVNTRSQVVASIFECFLETGMRLHQHVRSLSKRNRPNQVFLINLCSRLADMGFKMLQRVRVHVSVQISQSQMKWLATAALSKVLSRKQSEYPKLLERLREIEMDARSSMNTTGKDLTDMARGCAKSFADYVY